MAYGRKGLFDRALADLDFVIKADPKNPALIQERGMMKAQMGDGACAEADLCPSRGTCSSATAEERPR